MYRFAIIATCAAGVERPCGYENELSTPVESAFSTNRIWTCPNRVPERSLNARYATNAFRDTRRDRDGRLLNRGAGRAAAVMDLGEELQLADAGRPRDRDLGIGVHGERHHAVDIGRCQTRIVERIQHSLGGQPKLTAAGVLREVGRADPDNRRLPGQLTRHQAFPPMLNVAVAIT